MLEEQAKQGSSATPPAQQSRSIDVKKLLLFSWSNKHSGTTATTSVRSMLISVWSLEVGDVDGPDLLCKPYPVAMITAISRLWLQTVSSLHHTTPPRHSSVNDADLEIHILLLLQQLYGHCQFPFVRITPH